MNAPSTPESTALATASRQQFDLSPQTFEQALTFSQYLADSDLVPKDFKGKPGNCLIAMQWGSEIGLKPLQALSNIAVINGRAALWGDAVIALVRGSALCEYVVETDDGNAATCKVKRRGEPEQVRTFSMEDAQAAGLKGKAGPWTQYPKRMRQMRARAFALRDVFPDVLRGLPVAEEIMDLPAGEKHMGPAEVVQPQAPATYPQDQFEKNLPAWQQVIASGRKTPDQIIAMAETKHPLTDAQKAEVRKSPKPAASASTAASINPQTGGPTLAAASQVQDVAPKVTFAQVADKVAAAQDHDQLAEAVALIPAIADEGQRAELGRIADQRGDELAF